MLHLILATLLFNNCVLTTAIDTLDIDSLPFQTFCPGNWTFEYGEEIYNRKYVTFYMNGDSGNYITFSTGTIFDNALLNDYYIISLETVEGVPVKLYLDKKSHKIFAFTIMDNQYSGMICVDDKSYLDYEMVFLDMILSFKIV